MTFKALPIALAGLLMLGASTDAAMINTIIGNFDIAFDGATGELTDFNRPDGGSLAPGDARTVSSLEIEVDGVSEELLMNPPDALWADLKVTNLGSSLTTGSLVTGAGGTGSDAFGFDFFDAAGNLLRLELDDISYTLVETGIPGLNFFNWFAEAKVVDQSLPGGILYGEDVLVSYTATEVMVLGGGESLVASGAMTITGNLIPEPTTAILAMLAGVGVLARRR